MEILKVVIFVLCGLGLAMWGAWVAVRAEERDDVARQKESGQPRPPVPDT